MDVLFQCPSCCAGCVVAENVVSCASCKKSFLFKDGIYQFVQDKDTETWDHYWKRTPVYDDVLDVLRKMMNMQLKRYVKKYASSGDLTLEPGGGSAYVSALLAEEGYKAYAMDYASIALKIAQEQLKSRAVLVQGDLFKMPFASDVFDITFNNSTMEHFSNQLEGVKEMARVTKKGKYVFVGVPFTYG